VSSGLRLATEAPDMPKPGPPWRPGFARRLVDRVETSGWRRDLRLAQRPQVGAKVQIWQAATVMVSVKVRPAAPVRPW